MGRIPGGGKCFVPGDPVKQTPGADTQRSTGTPLAGRGRPALHYCDDCAVNAPLMLTPESACNI